MRQEKGRRAEMRRMLSRFKPIVLPVYSRKRFKYVVDHFVEIGLQGLMYTPNGLRARMKQATRFFFNEADREQDNQMRFVEFMTFGLQLQGLFVDIGMAFM